MELTKRKIRKKVSPEPVVVDDYHSLETPSCHLVVQVVKDIIPDLTISKTGQISKVPIPQPRRPRHQNHLYWELLYCNSYWTNEEVKPP
jgi:hypothetical protein